MGRQGNGRRRRQQEQGPGTTPERGKQKQLESAAIAEINQATLAGMKKGEEASKKLHLDAKTQTEEQTTEAIGKLKDLKWMEGILRNKYELSADFFSDLPEHKQEIKVLNRKIKITPKGADVLLPTN